MPLIIKSQKNRTDDIAVEFIVSDDSLFAVLPHPLSPLLYRHKLNVISVKDCKFLVLITHSECQAIKALR